jgi:hypothetical protein
VERPQEDLFIDNLKKYRNPKDAALAAGYSESYSQDIIYKKFRSERFLRKVCERYGVVESVLRLPQISQIRGSIYDIVTKDPMQEPKYKHIFKQDLQIAGVLASDAAPVQPAINIEAVQNLMLQNHNKKMRRLQERAVDHDIIDVTPEGTDEE